MSGLGAVSRRSGTLMLSRWWPRSWPWWVQAIAVFLGGRMVSAVIFLIVARSVPGNVWVSASPSYLPYVSRMWDCDWYRQIYESGYPAQLPVDASGTVQQNAWAFFPLFPYAVRFLHVITGLGWDFLAPTFALVCGTAAAVIIYRLVSTAGSAAVERRPGLPLVTVAAVAFFPSSPVLQVAYTESLALLLIAAALYLLYRRHYEWAALVVVLLGLTRAVALPLAVVVAWHAIMRWRSDRPRALDWWRMSFLFVVSVLSGFLWPTLCGWILGRPDAYYVTQAAWRSGSMTPIKPWFDLAPFWADHYGLPASWGIPLVVLYLVFIAFLVLCPVAGRLGPEMQSWMGAYALYLLGAVPLGTSVVRFMILAFPLGAVVMGWTRSKVWFWTIIVISTAGQFLWVWELWRVVPAFPP